LAVVAVQAAEDLMLLDLRKVPTEILELAVLAELVLLQALTIFGQLVVVAQVGENLVHQVAVVVVVAEVMLV
jgi:hypothetical protein